MNQTLSLFFGLSTTPLELISFLLAIVNVLFNIRQVHWAWLFAIVSSALYGVVFFEAKLYGDMGLQLVFIVVSAWGWCLWWRDARQVRVQNVQTGVQSATLSRVGYVISILAWLSGFAVLAWFLKSYTDTDVPHADGFLTAGSLLGQVLLSRKKIENWLVWIVVDVLYVGLYVHKNLILTAVLYAVFVVLAVAGWRVWRRAHSPT